MFRFEVSFGRSRLVVAQTASRAERTLIWKRFQERKAIVLREYGDASDIASVEKDLRALLEIK